MSPAPELGFMLCPYVAAPSDGHSSSPMAGAFCEPLDKSFTVHRDPSSFLDMDELCSCHGAPDKALFLIPEDNNVSSQQPVCSCSTLPGLDAQSYAAVAEEDMTECATCCFEKALHCLAMVDAPEARFCPSPRSHHCLASSSSPVSSDSDDDLPNVRTVKVTASTTASVGPVCAAAPEVHSNVAGGVHQARSNGPSATRNANFTLQFQQVITTEVLTVAPVPALTSSAAHSGAASVADGCSTGADADVSTVVPAHHCPVMEAPVVVPAPRAFHHKTGGPCDHCGATESPQWRRGPASKPTLCNACGTRYRRTNQLGPPSNSQAARAERAAQQAIASSAGTVTASSSCNGSLTRRSSKRDARDGSISAGTAALAPANKRQRISTTGSDVDADCN